MSKDDDIINGDTSLFSKYKDDIVVNIQIDVIGYTISAKNSLHPSL